MDGVRRVIKQTSKPINFFVMADARLKNFNTRIENSKFRHLFDFFLTRCDTFVKNKIDRVSDLALSARQEYEIFL